MKVTNKLKNNLIFDRIYFYEIFMNDSKTDINLYEYLSDHKKTVYIDETYF